MNTGNQIIARLQEIRETADAMLRMFDQGGDQAHAFWLHADNDVLGDVRDQLVRMDEAMRDEMLPDSGEVDHPDDPCLDDYNYVGSRDHY